MDSRQSKLVMDSAGVIFAGKGRMADLFYAHLFDIAPESRALFKKDMARQRKMFAAALGMVVSQIGDRERLMNSVEYVGRLHAQKGVTPEHLVLGARAFDRAVCEFFGDACSDALCDAWSAAYAEIAEVMVSAGGVGRRTPTA